MLTFIASLSPLIRSSPTPQVSARLPFRFRTALTGLSLLSACTFCAAHQTHCESSRAMGNKASTSARPSNMSTLSDLPSIKDIDGNTIAPSTFQGKVVFSINVASACGKTKSGYDLLKRLTEKYSSEDFVAVAIPCNSFMWQENGSPDEIKTFALARAEKLVITERSDVNGDTAHPIVQVGKSKFPGRIAWNFDGRYVFDRQGVPVGRFGNSATAEEIEAAIDSVL